MAYKDTLNYLATIYAEGMVKKPRQVPGFYNCWVVEYKHDDGVWHNKYLLDVSGIYRFYEKRKKSAMDAFINKIAANKNIKIR